MGTTNKVTLRLMHVAEVSFLGIVLDKARKRAWANICTGPIYQKPDRNAYLPLSVFIREHILNHPHSPVPTRIPIVIVCFDIVINLYSLPQGG